jgi:hypothetical protein
MRKLTGQYYFKQTIFGLILMVEHYKKIKMPDGEIIDDLDNKVWSKAKPHEITVLNNDYGK